MVPAWALGMLVTSASVEAWAGLLASYDTLYGTGLPTAVMM